MAICLYEKAKIDSTDDFNQFDTLFDITRIGIYDSWDIFIMLMSYLGDVSPIFPKMKAVGQLFIFLGFGLADHLQEIIVIISFLAL